MPGKQQHPRRLSVAMIAQDAAALVEPTLSSVAPIADEIVVADAGSTDNTRDKAESWASRVIDVPWSDDFSAARNACLSAVTGDWVLWLDAGETISETTAAALREFVESQADPRCVYKLLVQLAPVAGYFADQQIAVPRLMPRCEGLRFEGRVREQLVGDDTTGPLKPTILHWVIRRNARDHELAIKQRRAQRNLRLADLESAEHGLDARLWLVCGEALAQLGEYTEARRAYLKARHEAVRGSDEMLESYYGELTSYDNQEARRVEQLELCIEALEIFPTDVQLLCAMGGYLQTQQKIELAARAYKTAVEYGKVNQNIWHLADIREIAVVCLSIVYQLQDRTEQAQAVLQEALQNRPDSLRIRHQLFDFHIRQGRRKEALQQIEMLPADMPQRDAFANAVMGACLANEQDWKAAQAYLETAFEAGCRDAICFRALAATWFELGKYGAVEGLLDEWRMHDPESDELRDFAKKLPTGNVEPERTEMSGTGKLADRQFRVDGPKQDQPQPTSPASPAPQRRPSHVRERRDERRR